MTTTDWIYQILGWTLTGAGALWAVAALFRDRSRNRRRCPGCWYDMEGTPALQCPECGRTARTEQQLHRTRRRWKQALVAGVLGLVGLCTLNVREFQRGGMYALIPSALLVRIAPADYQPQSGMGGAGAFLLRGNSGGLTFLVSKGPAAPPVVTAAAPAWKPSADLREEVWARLQWERLDPAEARTFLRRYMRSRSMGAVPSRWIAGRFLPLDPSQPPKGLHTYLRCVGTEKWQKLESFQGPSRKSVHLLTPASATHTAIEHVFFFGKEPLYHGVESAHIELRPDEASLLDRLDPPQIGALLLDALQPRLVQTGTGPIVRMDDDLVRHGIEFAVDLELTVFDGDRPIGAGPLTLTSRREVGRESEDAAIEWSELPIAGRKFTLVLRGRPDRSTRRFLERPFSAPTSCWAGELRISLRLDPPSAPALPERSHP